MASFFSVLLKTVDDVTHCIICTQAEEAMKQYGKVLINEVPEEATQFLIRLCTGELVNAPCFLGG